MKVGRNDPCPCGSQKKYKKCCLIKGQESASSRVPATAPPPRSPTGTSLNQVAATTSAKIGEARFRLTPYTIANPEGDHCQGMRFLHCLRAVAPDIWPDPEPDLEPRVRTEVWADDANRMDIQIIGRHYAVIVEAKVNAPPDKEQLDIYWQLTTRLFPEKTRYGVFLTRDGGIPEGHDGFKGLSWGLVLQALTHFASENAAHGARNALVRALAQQYRDFLKEILKEEDYGEGIE